MEEDIVEPTMDVDGDQGNCSNDAISDHPDNNDVSDGNVDEGSFHVNGVLAPLMVPRDEPVAVLAPTTPAPVNHQNSLVVPSCRCDSSDIPQTPLQTLVVPCLIGLLVQQGTTSVCKGVWGMSEESHRQEGTTSEFEFKLQKPLDAAQAFPVSGKYQGWFMLKQPAPLKPLKVEDRDMVLRFTPTDDGSFRVDGSGVNKFGSFTLTGTLSAQGRLQMYRSYTPKTILVKPKSAATSASKPKASTVATPSAPTDATPRSTDGSGRVRKKTNFGVGFEVEERPTPRVTAAATPGPPSTPATATVVTSATSASPRAATGFSSARSPRMSQSMVRCGELLKELSKLPHSIWFAEPVDYVKLNIPDYPLIVKEPMDFRTIRQNLDSGVYATPEAFAEHVRLVFRNAVTFNTLKENPVHIAAKEVSHRFEDRFRALQASFANTYVTGEDWKSAGGTPAGGGGKKSSIGGGSTPRSRPSGTPRAGGRPSLGPRGADAFLPPPLDPASHYLVEMQKKMQEMESEIFKLRTQMQKSEVAQKIEIQRGAAQNPLTFDEKKILIAEIGRLPSNKMMEVIEIIKSVLPHDPKSTQGDEIEIPLDELDTLTLRRLQRFVADAYMDNNKKKRPSAANKEPAPKKVKKEKNLSSAPKSKAASSKGGAIVSSLESATAGPASAYFTSSVNESMEGVGAVAEATSSEVLNGYHGEDLTGVRDPHEESDELLFSSESFEELRAQVGHGSDDEDEEEENSKEHGEFTYY